jgi:hypothetical protein
VISDKYRSIYVHQRKAGGTSVKALFLDKVGALNNGLLDAEWHQDCRVERYFTFTIVRNPWDRFISAYLYIGALRRRSIEEVLGNMPNREPLRDILSGPLSSRLAYSRSHAFTYYNRARRFVTRKESWSQSRRHHHYNYMHAACPQSASVIDTDGRLAVDAVYYLEDMETALSDLSRRTGVPTASYRIRNAGTTSHDYRNMLSPAAKTRLDELFHQDIEFFGYSFADGPGLAPGPPIFRQSLMG